MFGLGLGLALGLGLRLSGGSGNSDKKPRNYRHCYYQHLWVVIPIVGNSANW